MTDDKETLPLNGFHLGSENEVAVIPGTWQTHSMICSNVTSLQCRRYLASERSINVDRLYTPPFWMLNGRGLGRVEERRGGGGAGRGKNK